MRYLVLGSSGLIGRGVVTYLRKRRHDVMEWDIQIDPSHDLRDVKNMSLLLDALSQVDFVFFLAFDVGGSKYLTCQNQEGLSSNIRLMDNTFDALEKSRTPFLFASSQMAYLPTPYGVAKAVGEVYTSNLKGLNVRLWNVYGPEESTIRSHVIADFIHMAKTQQCIKMRTNGAERRQFIYVEDVARVFEQLSDPSLYAHLVSDNQIIDISSGSWTTVYQLAQEIVGVLNESSPTTTTTIESGPLIETLTQRVPHPHPIVSVQITVSLRDGIQKCLS